MQYYKYFETIINCGIEDLTEMGVVYNDALNNMLVQLLNNELEWCEKIVQVFNEDIQGWDKVFYLKWHVLKRENAFLPNSKYLGALIDSVKEIKDKYAGKRFKGIKSYEDNNIHEFFIEKIKRDCQKGWIEVKREDIESAREEKTGLLSVSFISEQMLGYDSMVLSFFKNEVVEDRNLYRPYFFELEIDLQKLSSSARYRLFETEEDSFWECTLSDPCVETENNCNLIIGTSPLHQKMKNIEIEGRANEYDIKQIENTYKLTLKASKQQVEGKLRKVFGKAAFQSAKIYKVGDANCIYIRAMDGQEEKRLLFDVGVGYKKTATLNCRAVPEKYYRSIISISKFKPDMVIISHWDADHYVGCIYGTKNLFSCPWIAPNIDDAKINAKRVATYLDSIGMLNVLESKNEYEIIVNKELTVYKANKSDPYTSPINCRGITLYFHDTKKKLRTIMMGDVPYKALPDVADFENNNPYNTLVVPHHAAQMDYPQIKNCKGEIGEAIICCEHDWSEKKKHPCAEHVRQLQKCYNVIKTEDFKSSSRKIVL